MFGDTNLELPSFRSNRSVVEIHVKISSRDYANGEITLKLPLHARYQVNYHLKGCFCISCLDKNIDKIWIVVVSLSFSASGREWIL